MNRGKPDIRTVRRAMSNRPSHRASAMNATPMMRTPAPGANGVDASPTRSIVTARTKDGPDRGSDAQEASELEPLTGDRQHEKARPPEDDTMRRLAGEPEDQADPPGDGAQHHDRGGERRLAPENLDGRDHHDGAAEHHQPRAARRAHHQHQRAEAAGERSDVGPSAPQRDRALEANDRTEESSDHERAVKRDERRGRWELPAEPGDAAGERANERDATERQDGEAAQDHVHPSRSLAASDIIDGCHRLPHEID